jgi:hypothetical protein
MKYIEKLSSHSGFLISIDDKRPHIVTLRGGSKAWYVNGVYHREDGPAIIWNCKDASSNTTWDTRSVWYYEGKYVDCFSQQEFEKYLKLKAFW